MANDEDYTLLSDTTILALHVQRASEVPVPAPEVKRRIIEMTPLEKRRVIEFYREGKDSDDT